jgi:hypothetical protein
MWVIGPDSQFNRQGQLVGCPGGGEQGSPDRLVGHPGSWWECPDSPSGANLNSGHVAFQWRVGGVAYGLSLHGITEINRGLLRQLSGTVTLVGPRA